MTLNWPPVACASRWRRMIARRASARIGDAHHPPDRTFRTRGRCSRSSTAKRPTSSREDAKERAGAIESAISTLTRSRRRATTVWPSSSAGGHRVQQILDGQHRRRVRLSPCFPSATAAIPPFELSQLEDMLVDKKSYGLFVIDRSEAAYGIASGKRIHVQEHLVSTSWASTARWSVRTAFRAPD